MTTTPTLRTKQQLLAEMGRLVSTSNFNLATRDQFDRVKVLFDIANAHDGHGEVRDHWWHRRIDKTAVVELARRRHEQLRRDPAALEFFSTSNHDREPVVSDNGVKLTKEAFRVNARPVGEIVQLRSYTGLDTSLSGDAGGFTSPILFWRDGVIPTLKQRDELFLAARWVDTPSGGPFDMPLEDDISNAAAVVIETSGTVSDGPNAQFSQLQFGVAPIWSTGRIKLSLQLLQDSPVIEDALAKAFAKRFQRGMGAQFITTLLAGIGTTSAASPTSLTPDDLLNLIGGVDEEYARSGGWLMRYSTWIAIRKMITSNHYFVSNNAQVDSNMRPFLLERPVFFCPSMDAIGAGKIPVIFAMMCGLRSQWVALTNRYEIGPRPSSRASQNNHVLVGVTSP